MFDLSVPKGWKLVKLSDLGEVNRGRSRHRPRDAAHLYGGSYPFVQTGDVKASQGRITNFTQTYSEAGLAQSRLWPKNTMCITIAANIAETGILQFPACFPDSVIGFIHDESECNVYFVEYVFRLLRKRIQTQATGSVQDNINLQTLERLHFPLPELKVQNQLAAIMCSFDDKIELNRQINQTLEQMAQAIFKSWFVDFDPVKAKIAALEAGGSADDALLAAMQAIAGSALFATDAADADAQSQLARLQTEHPEQYATLRATAELFPSAMQNSELGDIPMGWRASKLSDEFDVTMGQSPPGHTYNEIGDGVPFFQGRRDFGVRYPSNRVYCTEPKRMAKAEDTLLSVRAPVGDTNLARTDCCIGRGVAALRHNSGCSSFTYYSVIQLGQALSSYDSEGTVFGSINQKNLNSLLVIAPPKEILSVFSQIVGATDSRIKSLSEEVSTLAELRDTLLPKLLSGELSISAATDQITQAEEAIDV